MRLFVVVYTFLLAQSLQAQITRANGVLGIRDLKHTEILVTDQDTIFSGLRIRSFSLPEMGVPKIDCELPGYEKIKVYNTGQNYDGYYTGIGIEFPDSAGSDLYKRHKGEYYYHRQANLHAYFRNYNQDDTAAFQLELKKHVVANNYFIYGEDSIKPQAFLARLLVGARQKGRAYEFKGKFPAASTTILCLRADSIGKERKEMMLGLVKKPKESFSSIKWIVLPFHSFEDYTPGSLVLISSIQKK